jgi:hypothetical protein
MATFFRSSQAIARGALNYSNKRMQAQISNELGKIAGAKMVTPGAGMGNGVMGNTSLMSPFKSTSLINGLGEKGFLNARLNSNSSRGFATVANATAPKRNVAAATLTMDAPTLTRAQINEQRFKEAITADHSGNYRFLGDQTVDAATQKYRVAGAIAFCAFVCLSHPIISWNAVRAYRAALIRKEDGEYMRGKTMTDVQNEVAGRHKTTTKFRVLKNLHTEARQLTRGPGDVGAQMHGRPFNTKGTIGKFS